MKPVVDLTLPVLNEEKTLQDNVLTILDYMQTQLDPICCCRLIIADNGSTDETQRIALSLENRFPEKIKYLRLNKRGVGLALKTSWTRSHADIVGYMDLDLATDITHVREALELAIQPKIDLVYGTRLHKNSKVAGRSLKRELISRLFNFTLQSYLKVGFSDGMCGFKFLKRKHIPSLIRNGAHSDGWFFCTEILVVAEWLGLCLYELPVQWTDDADSRVNIQKLTFEYLKGMKRLKHNHPRPVNQ